MKQRCVLVVAVVLGLFPAFTSSSPAQQRSGSEALRYLADNQLKKPENYREWVYLSTGKGMSYGPLAQFKGSDPPFDNVFAEPSAYREFLQTGTWPDKTILILEAREALSKGSINQSGNYQGKVLGVEAEVKDESRFPGKWAFYGFGTGSGPVQPLPVSAPCYSCHAQNGGVDNTFVQFYPTLLEVARRKGTLKAVSEPASSQTAQ